LNPAGRPNFLPVTPQQSSVQEPAEVLRTALLEDDLVRGGAVVIIV
jgi:hypothetical protein